MEPGGRAEKAKARRCGGDETRRESLQQNQGPRELREGWQIEWVGEDGDGDGAAAERLSDEGEIVDRGRK